MADWRNAQPTSELSHFPPGYPALIAVMMHAGMSAVQGARLIDIIASGVTVALMVLIVSETVGIVAGCTVGIALLVAQPIVLVQLMILSEPLFLCLVAFAALALTRRWPALVAGLIAAAAVTVRYAGVSIVAAVIVWQLLDPVGVPRRVGRAIAAAVPALAVSALWVLYLRAAGVGLTGIRRAGVYGGFSDTIEQGVRTLVAWLIPTTKLPGPARLWVGLAVGIVTVFIAGLGVRETLRRKRIYAAMHDETRETGALRLLAVCAVMSVCYIAVLVVSRLFADPKIPFDARILSPLVLLLMAFVAAAIVSGWDRWGMLLRYGIATAFVAWLIGSAAASGDDAAWAVTHGAELAGAEWRRSELLDWVRSRAESTPLYSNWPAAIHFYVQRPAWELPDTTTPSLARAFADTLAARGAFLVAFDAPNPYGALADSLAAAARLPIIARLNDGTVYGPPLRGIRSATRDSLNRDSVTATPR